jgi:MerR family copper efflux transcriptional regulator
MAERSLQRAIASAARQTGLTPKMIRHYEQMGLFSPVARTEHGYRQYSPQDIHTLNFIRRCRQLDFSLSDISTLLDLWRKPKRASAAVRQVALSQISTLEQRIRDLQAMKHNLEQLVAHCHGNQKPDCAILNELAQA